MDDKNKIIKSFLSKAKKSNEEITTSLPKINNKGSIDSLEMDNIIMKTASKDLSESNKKKIFNINNKFINDLEDLNEYFNNMHIKNLRYNKNINREINLINKNIK